MIERQVLPKLVVNRDSFKRNLVGAMEKISTLELNPPEIQEFDNWAFDIDNRDTNILNLLRTSFNNPENIYYSKYVSLIEAPPVGISVANQIKRKQKLLKARHEILVSIHDNLDLLSSDENESQPIKQPIAKPNAASVFVVHGQQNQYIDGVARTIQQLGLKPVILHEQPSGGLTIIEKFEQHAPAAGFAIVLLTADDVGRLKTEEADKKRARQNVILELGYFWGRLGRKNVMILYEDGVALPSDIHGFVYTPLRDIHKWRQDIVRELKNAGYNVDANNLL